MRNLRSAIVLLIVIGVFTICRPALAQTPPPHASSVYYVDPVHGSDTNKGLTASTAFKTAKYASLNIGPGDTVDLIGGTYTNDCIYGATGGTQGSPVTYQAYNGQVPVFVGFNPSCGVQASLTGSWMVMDGLHFENTSLNADLYITGKHIVVQNCVFLYNGDGVKVGGSFILNLNGSYVTIQNNYFDSSGVTSNRGQGSALYIVGCDHTLVQNNYFTRLGHAAVDVHPETNTGVLVTPSVDTVIRNNTVDQHWGGGFYCGPVTNLLIENNVINYVGEQEDMSKAGIVFYCQRAIARNNIINLTSNGSTNKGNAQDAFTIVAVEYKGVPDTTINDRVYNNDTYKTGRSPLNMAQQGAGQTLTANKIVNNIFYWARRDCSETSICGPPYWSAQGPYYIVLVNSGAPFANLTNSNYIYNNLIGSVDKKGDRNPNPNLIMDASGTNSFAGSIRLAEAQSKRSRYFFGNLEANPRFNAPDAGDYSLQPGSPAIGAGAHLAHTTAAGTSTTKIPVDDPYFFTDGFGMVPGDSIKVGSNSPVTIAAIDDTNKILTVATPISFASGDNVDLPFSGTAPDIGAIQHGTVTSVNVNPKISSGSSSSSPSGTTVTLEGVNFTSSNNTVTIVSTAGEANIGKVSSNGTSLSFTVPASIAATTYFVFVNNAHGVSNAVTYADGHWKLRS